MTHVLFKNRIEAGEKLAGLLSQYKDKNVIIYALPRGGVVIGAEIAKALHAPLDLIITRKIGHLFQNEYVIGAVLESGQKVFDNEAILDIDKNYLIEETEKQILEAKRRRKVYLAKRKPIRGSSAFVI